MYVTLDTLDIFPGYKIPLICCVRACERACARVAVTEHAASADTKTQQQKECDLCNKSPAPPTLAGCMSLLVSVCVKNSRELLVVLLLARRVSPNHTVPPLFLIDDRISHAHNISFLVWSGAGQKR